MPQLDELYKKHKGQDIYIVGTGPSFSLFPKNWLDDKITIGLNQAYKLSKLKYNLTIHPYLIPLKQTEWNGVWITKTKISDDTWKTHLKNGNTSKFYLFKNPNNPLDFSWLNSSRRPPNCLYVGCGIQTGAMHLAAIMGAKNIFLIGCDFGCCGYNHHAHYQHTEFHQYSAYEVYNEYYYYTEKVREELSLYYKINIFQLSYTLGMPKYTDLLIEKNGLKESNPPVNIEVVKRTTPLVTNYI